MRAMRKLVIALSLTSVALAASTIYFASELAIERGRLAGTQAADGAAAQPMPIAPAPVSATAPAPTASANPADNRKANAGFSSEPAVAPALTEADIRSAQAEYSRIILTQLADPERREEMLAEHKMMMRYSYPRVDQVLGLSAAEHSKLLELFAQQQMDMQEASAHCMADPTCQLQDLHRSNADSRKSEINELLGPERAAMLETYKKTTGEREAVNQLRNRLPDVQRLSDADTELLVAALAEERELISREAPDARMNSFSMGAGLIFAPSEGGSFEERYETASRNSQRLRERAAQILNAEQMRAFNEMQDETLISLRAMLRQKDSMSFSASGLAIADPVN